MVPFMTMPALQSLSQISSQYKELVVTHLDLSYDEALRRYVDDPHGLRGTMRMLGAIISGSFALAFVMRNTDAVITPGDLDLYVPTQFAKRFVAYLVNVEGYHRIATANIPYGRNSAHRPVILLAKQGVRIDVVPSNNEAALFPLSHFWSTHVMNFLSADTFSVAYPDLTFAGRGLLSPFQLIAYRHTSEYIITLIRKYEARGFSFRVRPYAWGEQVPSVVCDVGPACSRTRRFFGDRFCLGGPISRDYSDCGYYRGLPANVTVCWWRGGDSCGVECEYAEVVPERATPDAMVLEADRVPHAL